jgi:hypothetical protein
VQPELTAARGGPQRRYLALQHRPAPVDHGDVLTQVLHQVELVAGEHHRAAFPGPLPQALGQACDGHGVQSGERLVEHDHVRVVDECGGQLQPLLLTTGERVRSLTPPIGYAELVEQHAGLVLRVTAGQTV